MSLFYSIVFFLLHTEARRRSKYVIVGKSELLLSFLRMFITIIIITIIIIIRNLTLLWFTLLLVGTESTDTNHFCIASTFFTQLSSLALILAIEIFFHKIEEDKIEEIECDKI